MQSPQLQRSARFCFFSLEQLRSDYYPWIFVLLRFYFHSSINDSKVIYFEPFIAAEDFIFLTLLLLRMEEIILVANTTTINA